MPEHTPPLFDLNVETGSDHLLTDPFVQLKGEFEVMSQEAKVVSLGKLSDLLPDVTFRGNISITRRLETGSATIEGLAQANEALHKSYVPTTPGASLRCVDGRGILGYDDEDPKSYEVGPQVQGGTPDIAVARRLRKGVDVDAKLESDIDELVSNTSQKYLPSGHTDDHTPDGEFGCGALKGQEVKLGYYEDAGLVDAISGVTGAVMDLAGKKLHDNFAETLQQNAKALSEISNSYFAGKPDILEYLEKFNKDAKRVKTGNHNEFKVVLNFVHGTTLNSGKMNMLTDGEYNAFGLDVWYIMENFGDDAPFILADALATLINLTDGSLEVEARLPVEDGEAAA